MEKIMTVNNLNYKHILKDISFQIEKNKIIAFSGSNNCGKTTLMKILGGVLTEEESVLFENAYLNAIPKTEIYQKIGIVIPSVEAPFLFQTVEQELQFLLDHLDLPKEQRKKRYKWICSLFKLKNETSKNPNMLSTFQKIKVNMALATVQKPKLLILDDIYAHLTKEEAKEILSILEILKEEMTIIMTTMNLEYTLNADYLYILDQGQLVLEGSPLDVMMQDSRLNKMGLSLPFMVDLSLKLKYYDLLEKVEIDMDRLVNTLWK